MPKDLLTLESVRPGLMAKGSFKNSKSKGKVHSKVHSGNVHMPMRGHKFWSLEVS